MICPHCEKDVRFKQRTGHTCGLCRRRFALEPKETLLRTGDMRMRRVSAALSEDGALTYTPHQLFWRLARNRIEKPVRAAAINGAGFGMIAGIVLSTALVPVIGAAGLVVAVGALVACILLAVALASGRDRVLRRVPKSAEVRQVAELDRAWRRVYSKAPQGLASDEDVRVALQADPVEDAVAVVACPDRDVLGCLALNGVPELFGVALLRVGGPGGDASVLDSGAPILFLHDASAAGLGELADARARWGAAQVVDVGLKVAHVRGSTVLPELHGPPVQLDARVEVDDADRDWLADGHSVALAAIAPSRLIAAVERAVADLTAADAERRRARLAGFV